MTQPRHPTKKHHLGDQCKENESTHIAKSCCQDIHEETQRANGRTWEISEERGSAAEPMGNRSSESASGTYAIDMWADPMENDLAIRHPAFRNRLGQR